MPVFDFKNTPDKNEEFVCTYTTYASNAPEASVEEPLLILDNSFRAWKHYSAGVFSNQSKKTAF